MPGHVFAVQGRMESLANDAVVITTDGEFRIEPHWHAVLGTEDPDILRPESWGRDRRWFGRAPGRDDVWFLNVVDASGSLADLLTTIRATLDAIAQSDIQPSAGRALPLVAVPVPGIGGGGFQARAGAVVAGLLDTLWSAVAEHRLDVVIVATTAAQFAAVQRERRLAGSFPLDRDLLETAQEIGDEAARGNLALFLGAGVSVSAGLPSWADLVEEMRGAAIDTGAHLPAADFASMSVLDQTELLRAVLGEELESLVADRFRSATPALSHALLAGLRCVEAVTTNYDHCYEMAVAARDPAASVAVMPWEKPTPGRPWLLKLHGDAERPGSVVLTRGQFIGYDSQWRPVGSVFQSLLMTRKLLVVGASLSDDNVLRLAHEVRALRRRHHIDDSLGHVLGLGPPPLRAQLWEGEMDWVALPAQTSEEQVRRLEIFLDAVAMHSFRASPYLLDPDYADLLNGEDEAKLARTARELAARISAASAHKTLRQGSAWQQLLEMLQAQGGGPSAEEAESVT